MIENIMGCGLVDVRQRPDGTYYCPSCKKGLGKDFRDRVRALSGPRWLQKLDDQCVSPGNTHGTLE